MALKQVVLPAPLGPMSPRISPSYRVSETWSSATTPPKRSVTLSTSSSGVRPSAVAGVPSPPTSIASVVSLTDSHLLAACLELLRAAAVGPDTLRPEDHHDDQQAAEDEVPQRRGAHVVRPARDGDGLGQA